MKGQRDFSTDDKSTISLSLEPDYLIRGIFIAVESSVGGGGCLDASYVYECNSLSLFFLYAFLYA
jgi:hypothetical protein